MTQVKICGITRLEDAVRACECGADLIGFIFIPASPRRVSEEKVKTILEGIKPGLRKNVKVTGLFLDQGIETIESAVVSCGLDNVQLMGLEKPEFCRDLKLLISEKYGKRVDIIKTFKVGADIMPNGPYIMDDYREADYFLFDTFRPGVPGGTGKTFDWRILAKNRSSMKKPFFLAGGLGADNVAEAIIAVRPYGVDVSSGIETKPGEKDPELLKEFVSNAKKTKTTG